MKIQIFPKGIAEKLSKERSIDKSNASFYKSGMLQGLGGGGWLEGRGLSHNVVLQL